MTIRALDLIAAQPWAITEPGLEQILAIAQGLNDAPEAVAARLGRPLDNTHIVTQRDGAAIIPVTGPIFRRANLFTEISGATSVEVLARDIQTAIDDPAIERLILDIDSPGGQAAGIGDLAAMIHASPKPVVAHVDNLAASAAYWIAAAAHDLVVSPGAMLGSIGVVATYRPEKDAPIKIISSQSPLKQATPDTETGRAEHQRLVDQLAAVFITDVARYRRTDPETVAAQFGQGGLRIAAEACAVGMADRVASFESLFSHAGPAAGPQHKRGIHMTYQAKVNAEFGLPADASAEQALQAIGAKFHDAKIEAHTTGRSDGATAERERIQSVRAQLIPGHEALIEQLAFDGKTTGPEAAVAVLAAERQLRDAHAAAQASAPAPVAAALPPEPDHNTAAADRAAVDAARQRLFNQVAGRQE